MPLRYQGQYEDAETGLCYNRFRYYDSAIGGYISQDPIGLEGNNPNFYAYVSDPNIEIDPFGLDLITVYHYSSKEGINGIKGSGVIKASDPSARGQGKIDKPKAVYVTAIKPEDLQRSGRRKQMGLTKEKSTHYVEFQIDDSKIKKVDRQDNRLRLYIEEDIQLRDSNNKLKKGVSFGETPCK
jgi:RHS repeat-associated protein